MYNLLCGRNGRQPHQKGIVRLSAIKMVYLASSEVLSKEGPSSEKGTSPEQSFSKEFKETSDALRTAASISSAETDVSGMTWPFDLSEAWDDSIRALRAEFSFKRASYLIFHEERAAISSFLLLRRLLSSFMRSLSSAMRGSDDGF